MWFMDGSDVVDFDSIGNVDTVWSIVGYGDFNRDCKADILWRYTNPGDRALAIWLMDGSTLLAGRTVGRLPFEWWIRGISDHNGDGAADILWHHVDGRAAVWLMNGFVLQQGRQIAQPPTVWQIED